MGIFAPDGRPGLNLDPEAWRSNYAVKMKAPPGESPFPAQLRWRTLMRCRPLKEHLWAHIPSKSQQGGGRGGGGGRGRGGGPTHYELTQTAEQARALARLFLQHPA